jgi:hypothetical protein
MGKKHTNKLVIARKFILKSKNDIDEAIPAGKYPDKACHSNKQ